MPGKNRSKGRADRPSRSNRPSRKARPSRQRTFGFLSVDGESVTVGDEHTYVLLATSDGKTLWNDYGNSTATCFEFLLAARARNPKKRMVAFGLTYDVNMMLRDLAFSELQQLWETHEIVVTLANGVAYRLEWIPGKTFAVKREGEKNWARISDVFGFFQSSFVIALEKWGIPDPGGHIARMKGERGTFTLEQREEITAYCLAECDLLVSLMDALEESLAGADLKPSAWIGAGSVAASMLRKQGVKEYRKHDSEFPEPVYDAIMHAYFGGRTEVFLQGSMQNVVNYDLCSAYPSEALHLPSLASGLWWESGTYVPSENHALWFCEWDCPASFSFMPFPVRVKGSIFYPQNGSGWYHAKEVRNAMAIYGDRITVRKGYIFAPLSDDKPFAFIREAYQLRAELKKAGHASEKALKLGLNSLYGKLAQGIGFHGKTPPFQSFYWAGAITSGTRAKLLDLAAQNISGVVSVATDGIIFSGDPDFITSDNLGGLEKTVYKELFVAQPGIYRAVTDEDKVLLRSRGFFTREIDYEDLQQGWAAQGPHYVQRGVCRCGHVHTGECSRCDCQGLTFSTRFVGLGSALMRTDPSATWRKWLPSDRSISLYSSRKFYDRDIFKGRVMRLYPPRMPSGTISEVYRPKGAPLGQDLVNDSPDYVQGLEQPLVSF